MKILHVIIGLDVGGAELMLKRLVALDPTKSHVSHLIVSVCDLGIVGHQIRNQGVEVIALGLNSPFKLPVVFLRLVRLVRNRNPDIVQTWMYHADLIGGLAARLGGCRKIIWSVRNTDVFSNKGVSRSMALIMKLCAVLSGVVPHTIVCVAHRAKLIHAKNGYARSKMTVIGNGFDLEIYKPNLKRRKHIRESLNIPTDALIIGSIGRFNQYKDHHNFISSVERLASADKKVYFLLVGREVDSNNQTIMGWINKTGYSDRFRLLGERSDIPDILCAMDIFCLHSKSEGFPNVLGEAMSVALPSVVTDVGDAALLLGDAGLVVPPAETESLTRGLLKMIRSSSSYRTLLGSNARRRIEENYSITSVQRQYEELYQTVLST